MESKWFYIAVIVIICVYKAEDISAAVKPLLNQPDCPTVVQEVKTTGVPTK